MLKNDNTYHVDTDLVVWFHIIIVLKQRPVNIVKCTSAKIT